MNEIKKAAAEIIPVSVNFVPILPAGETLQVTSTVVIYDRNDADVTSSLLDSLVVNPTKMIANVKGGSRDLRYKISFFGITQNYEFREDVYMDVT